MARFQIVSEEIKADFGEGGDEVEVRGANS